MIMDVNQSVKHSGRLGDILYSLALVKYIAEKNNKLIDFYVSSDMPAKIGLDVFHPSLDVMVNEALFDYIEPLIASQKYINKFVHIPTSMIPSEALDLDRFKSSGLNLKAGLIYAWYRKAFGYSFPLDAPWFFMDIPMDCSDTEKRIEYSILISRTTRFCNTKINYSFLDKIDRVGFVGLDYEYEDFIRRYALKNIQYVRVKNALELALLMRQAKVFLGNQSSNFAIAEGLKIPRALEAFEPVPVASPIGGVCFEYINTRFLVSFLSEILQIELLAPEDIADGDYHESIKTQDGYTPSFKKRFKKIFGIAKKSSF